MKSIGISSQNQHFTEFHILRENFLTEPISYFCSRTAFGFASAARHHICAMTFPSLKNVCYLNSVCSTSGFCGAMTMNLRLFTDRLWLQLCFKSWRLSFFFRTEQKQKAQIGQGCSERNEVTAYLLKH